MKSVRQSNIEGLRILSIIGVIVLHYNNPNMGGALAFVETKSVNFYTLYFLESLFICAVNLFMIVSGFFSCDTYKRNLWKPLELMLQVVVFAEIFYFINILMGAQDFSLKTLIWYLIPKNYFVILYLVIYFMSPYINILLAVLDKKSIKKLMLTVVLLFSVYPTIVDVVMELYGKQINGISSIGMYGSQWGYTAINFGMMYLIGATIRKLNVQNNEKITKPKLIFALIGCVFILIMWSLMNDITGFHTERSGWEYCNTIVVLEAVIIFLLFSKIDFGIKKWINRLAEAAFTVYLLNSKMLSLLNIEKYVHKSVFMMLTHILLSAVCIYLLGWIVFWLYNKVTSPVFNFLKEKINLPQIDLESEINVRSKYE